MEPHLWLYCMIALHTLQRPSAILSLQTSQVRLDEGIIDFLPAGAAQSRKRRPVVPISPSLSETLAEAIPRSRSGYVVEYKGGPVACIRRSFRTACEQAGLHDATPYTLRHTGATLLLAAGVPIREVAGMLGHTEQATTERYGKHHPRFLARARDGVEGLFGRPSPAARQSRARPALPAPGAMV